MLLRFALLLLAAISLAHAQEVVVTATRFPQNVARLPASTTVIDAEDIARSPARTLPELLSSEVGVTMRDLFGNNAAATSVDLRGFGATGSQNALVLLDGRRLSDLDLSSVQWSAVPLSSVERIEILRGTGAVLYGDAATTGVINIVTRSPLKHGPAGEALLRAGTFNTGEAQVYGSTVGEVLGVNGSIYGYASDGYRANNRNEQRNAALNLRWALGDGALDLRFATDRQDLRLPGFRRIRPSIGLDEFASDPRGTQTPNDFSSRDGIRASAELAQRVGEAELSLGLDYRDKDARIFNEPFFRYQADDLSLRSLSPRARVPFATGALRHQLTLGVDWREWRYKSRRADRPENGDRPANRLDVTQKTTGIYFHDAIELDAATSGTVGYRRERGKYAALDEVDPASPACFFCTGAPTVRESQKQRAWELGLRRQVVPAIAVFARANRSFRFVTVDEIYEFSLATFSNTFDLLQPQSARTHEIGTEWRRGGHALRAALFETEVANEIHLNPLTFDNVNLPPSRRRGLELEGRWQALRSVRLTAGYAHTQARFVEGTLPGTGASIAGKTVPLVPRDKLNLGAFWEPAAGTQLSAMLTAVGEQRMENDQTNTFPRRIPSYAVVDAKLAQRFSWGRLAFSVNNLLDRDYFAYAVNSNATDLANVYPQPGRAFYVTAEVRLP
ncbi:MAG TPA: TonB-dependent receptor [Burkholderiales bacterium]|nr:TonB-dependent receptor [Burkholderiales bacterium]